MKTTLIPCILLLSFDFVLAKLSKPFNPFKAARSENKKGSSRGRYRGEASQPRRLLNDTEDDSPDDSQDDSQDGAIADQGLSDSSTVSPTKKKNSGKGSKKTKNTSAPSYTVVPTDTPTNPTTGSPTTPTTESPTASPSGPTTESPTTSPNTITEAPTLSPQLSNTVAVRVDDSEGVLESCQSSPVPAGASETIEQSVNWTALMCLESTFSIDDVTPGIITNLTEALSDEFLNCTFDKEWNVYGIFMPNIGFACESSGQCDFANSANCDQCLSCTHTFRVDLFTRDLPVTRRLVSIHQHRRADLLLLLENNVSMDNIGAFLISFMLSLPGLIPGIQNASFHGFTNVAVNTQETTPGSDTSGGANGFLQQDGGGSDDSSSSYLIPVLVVACATIFVVVISVGALRHRRENEKARAMSHTLMKEEYDDDGTELDRASYSTGAIMKDLADDADFDYENETTDDSIAVSRVSYPQVYVLGEGDNSTTADEDDEVRFTSRTYMGRGSQSPGQGPTFVTTDLKKAMRDLEPPPPTPHKPRGYVHDDTVDL
eukprot:CAMPEP_0198146474 /NCGR_PEP_ID=MMETSP1443-20131203/29599_1 /TAXON_ID=186043 /ORGANISM="Entomoneis sp., Strain CCMP2396" /LENGTH=543 /DNA_ID=CAMNT_0043810457 /DNA_START=111 /DNA_END=1742 /DNA_ORIENTATION=+